MGYIPISTSIPLKTGWWLTGCDVLILKNLWVKLPSKNIFSTKLNNNLTAANQILKLTIAKVNFHKFYFSFTCLLINMWNKHWEALINKLNHYTSCHHNNHKKGWPYLPLKFNKNFIPVMETSSKYWLQMSLSIGEQQASCFSAVRKTNRGVLLV